MNPAAPDFLAYPLPARLAPWPQARPPDLARCLLLALLLHLWLVLTLGNAPGGSARPGQGVWGTINVTLRGPVSEVARELPPLPPQPGGAPGDAPSPRWGGAVRSAAAPADAAPGAARQGLWTPRTDTQSPAATGSTAPAPTRATPLPLPLPLVTPNPAALPPPPGRVLEERALPMLPPAPAPNEPAPVAPEPPGANFEVAPSGTTPGEAIATLRNHGPASFAAVAPLATTPALPARVAGQGLELPALPALATALDAPRAEGRLAPRAEGRLAPSAPGGAAAAAAGAALPAAAALAVPAPLAHIQWPLPTLSPQLPAAPMLPPAMPVPAPEMPVPPARAVTSGAPDTAAAAPAASAPAAALPERSLASVAATAAEGPESAAAQAAPPSTTLELPSVETPAPPMHAAHTTLRRLATPTPRTAPPGAAAELAPTPRAAAVWVPPVAGVPGPPLAGAPVAAADAGAQVGRDVATAASNAASAPPRLNLELARPRGGELSRGAASGVLPVLPRPPELSDKLARDIENSARRDCRDAYAGAGVMAAVPLVRDALRRDGSCKW